MKLVRFTLVAAACLIVFKLISKPDSSLKQLEADFRAANQAKTIEPMLSLYHLEGSDKFTISRLKLALQNELALPIAKIRFEPLSGMPEETVQFIRNGVRYGPTLEPLHKMRVTYRVEDHFSSLYTIGKTETGAWKFISAKPVSSSDR